MIKICPPALIYVIFSLTQIVIDTIKGLYNTAFLKFIVSILITILLDALCKSGMSVVSWIIVFIPFIFMTFIVSILLYVFGLDIATGKLNITCETEKTNNNTGNLIFSSSSSNTNTTNTNPEIYHLELTNEETNTTTTTDTSTTNTTTTHPYVLNPFNSSDPQYESFVSSFL